MRKRVYVLLYDHRNNCVWVPINSDNTHFCPGGISMFGGEVERGESDREALEREVKQESKHLVSLEKKAKLTEFHRAEINGNVYCFYLTADFKNAHSYMEGVKKFKKTEEFQEKKGFAPVPVDDLRLQSPTEFLMAKFLTDLATGHFYDGIKIKKFLESETSKAFFEFVKIMGGGRDKCGTSRLL